MTYLISIVSTLGLLAGFLALTNYEARRGTRLFAPIRFRLDRRVERLEFVLAHVDLGAFLRDEILRIASRVGHDSAQISLRAVRAVERFLTRTVRYLRMRHTVAIQPRGSKREFVKTLSDFKSNLETTRPDSSEIL